MIFQHSVRVESDFVIFYFFHQNPELESVVKAEIVSSLGELALAIRQHFEPYFPTVMGLIETAAKTEFVPQSEDEEEMLISLRENILQSYQMILQSLVNKSLMLPHISALLDFLTVVGMDKDYRTTNILCSIVTLLG
jgi:hypothetical protein